MPHIPGQCIPALCGMQLDRGDSLGSKRGRKLTKACVQKDGYRATEKAEYESWDVAASRPA